MNGRWRRSTAAILAALALLTVGAGSGARLVAAAAQPGQPALQELGTCIGTSGRLLVLLLIDESGSLQQTDPGNQRVTAAKAALASLENLGWLVPSRRPTVDVQLASFSADYRPVGGWTQVDPGSIPRLQAQVDGFATRNRGIDTDFAHAIQGARRSLAERSAELSKGDLQEPCQALLLFTDGDYDLEHRGAVKDYAPGVQLLPPENVDKVITAGKRLLCRPGGVVDQLRSDGVTTVSIALTTRISRADQGFLESIAEGKGGAAPCGRDGSPATGVYLPARDLFGLLLAFDGIVNRILAEGTPVPIPGPITPCERAFCPSGTRTIRVDPGMRGFHLLADLGGQGIEVELRSPGGRTPLVLDQPHRAAARIGSARAGYRWLSPTALTVDVTLPRGRRDWVGEWSVTFVDRTGRNRDAVARSRIYLYGDLRPALVGMPKWRRGESGPIEARIVDADGNPLVAAGLVSSTELSAVVTDPKSRAAIPVELSAPDQDGVMRGAWAVPTALQESAMNLTLWLRVTTRSGLAMVPVSETYRVPVKPPVSYPAVSPPELRLSPVIGKGVAEGTIALTGGSRGGCVWFDPPSFTAAPDDAGRITASFDSDATSQGRCIKLAAGERRDLRVSATPEGAGVGAVRGVLVANVTSSTEARPLAVRVPVSFAMDVDPTKRLELFLLILLAGIALPIAALAALNLLFAKFEPTDLLRAAKVPVVVDGDRVQRLANDGRIGEPLGELRPEEFRNLAGGSSVRLRSLPLDGLHLRARAPRLPIKAPFGEAVADGRCVTASEGAAATRRAVRGRLPLELGGTWVFVLGDPPTREIADGDDSDLVAGTLHAFLDEPLDDKGASLAEVVQRDLPAAARKLAGLAAERRPADADGTSGPGSEPGLDTGEPVSTPGPRGPVYGDSLAGDPGDVPPPPNY
jgi:hypothetical protein